MINPLQPFIDAQGVVLLDGALATELERRGADLNDPLWSAKILLESPDLIRDVHREYFDAGADVATTASYQATFEGLARRGLSESEAADLIRLSVELAQEARAEFWAKEATREGRLRPIIAGSVGSYGAYLADGSEYSGDYGLSRDELIAFHRPRIEVLADAGIDILACETIPSLHEAEALAALLAEFPGLPAWVSFSCRDESHVGEGAPLVDCAAVLQRCNNVVAIGINCTPPRYIGGLVNALAGVTDKAILTYPTSGETWNAKTRSWSEHPGPPDFLEAARVWYEAGARGIGGCCRTTPQTIRRLSGSLRSRA